VHEGGYFAPHGTNNFFFTYAVLGHLRAAHQVDGPSITYLMGGSLASRGALVELFLCIPRPRSFSLRRTLLQPSAHRDGMGSGG
jgi:hypothetical protein